MKKLLSIFLPLFLLFQSCENKTKKSTKINSKQKNATEVNTIPVDFESQLRPNEKLKLGKIYTDTVKYVSFDDNGDNWLVLVKKNNDTIGLVYNTDQNNLINGDEIKIEWKMDSIRNAGDPEFIDHREFLIKTQKIKKKVTPIDYNKIKNESFVISCGTGCAMTHNIGEITQINSTTIKVVFEIEQYIDDELTETFNESFIFKNDKNFTIERINTDGKNENIEKIFFGSALQSFQSFGQKLML